MRAYRTDRKPRRARRSRRARSRGPASARTASWAHQRESEKASDAPSVAAAIEIGVPSAVPKSRPLAPASSGPGNRATVSSADRQTNTTGPAAPKPSTQSRTRSGLSDPLSARTATSEASSAASPPTRARAAPRDMAASGGGAAPGEELGLLLAQLGDGRVAVHPLAGDTVPVAAGPQLAQHRERQHLQPPAEEMVRRQRLVAHLREEAGPRIRQLDHHPRRDLRLELDLLVDRVPPRDLAELGQDALRRVARGVLHEAAAVQLGQQLLGAAFRPQPLDAQLELGHARGDALVEAEVQEGHAAV